MQGGGPLRAWSRAPPSRKEADPLRKPSRPRRSLPGSERPSPATDCVASGVALLSRERSRPGPARRQGRPLRAVPPPSEAQAPVRQPPPPPSPQKDHTTRGGSHGRRRGSRGTCRTSDVLAARGPFSHPNAPVSGRSASRASLVAHQTELRDPGLGGGGGETASRESIENEPRKRRPRNGVPFARRRGLPGFRPALR